MSEHLLCLIRLIDAGLWEKIDGLQEIYCQLDTLAAAKISTQMNEYVDKTIKGGSKILSVQNCATITNDFLFCLDCAGK